MDNAEPETGTHSRDPIPAEKESVENIEDLVEEVRLLRLGCARRKRRRSSRELARWPKTAHRSGRRVSQGGRYGRP